ncbi:MAG: uncharacterized protein K0S58_3125 [Nitrospira sp.]|nr:uncharacterized protein [Nitrospira sp.]
MSQQLVGRIRLAVAAVALVLSVGCTLDPQPIIIHEDTPLSVWLKFDPSADAGHSHPAAISSDQIAAILRGIGLQPRDHIAGFGLFAKKSGAPAFLSAEVAVLAPFLSQAFAKASPKDMVTFYLLSRNADQGDLVTSGGLFLRNRHLYVILANAHSSKYSVQYENAAPVDTRDQPLLPLARYRFSTVFTPQEAWIPNKQVRGKDGYRRYFDETKLIVVDLDRLPETTDADRQGDPRNTCRIWRCSFGWNVW